MATRAVVGDVEETAPAGLVMATVMTAAGAAGTGTAMTVVGTAIATMVMTAAGTATVMVGAAMESGHELVGAAAALVAATMTRPRGGLIAVALVVHFLGAVGTMTPRGVGRQAAAMAVLTAPRLTGW